MKNIIFTILLVTALVTGCEPSVQISFCADREEGVYYYAPDFGEAAGDTSIYFSREYLVYLPFSTAYGFARGHTEYGMITVDQFFSKMGCDTVSFFFFSKDIVDSNSWEKIVEDYMILQRYDIGKGDLLLTKGVLYFPPTKEMENINMWPPYGTYDEYVH